MCRCGVSKCLIDVPMRDLESIEVTCSSPISPSSLAQNELVVATNSENP